MTYATDLMSMSNIFATYLVHLWELASNTLTVIPATNTTVP